ncbi:DUF3644 domain-containing protein [Chamaesiphon polymorphus]|uniref:DZIP3-like HEPN domain-containing protein n=1 Tax=Chamaesiphon polymorphus CCALA 037 TaxID=2107692 RepID=A0A2T1GFP2_9CYAN|nr:DUF3644 domain-containing protein [Chamaesiphon polymorphus]PSB56365.1 hypothetical protein C7B77_12130 [Chamaesiphon polymorphus CCALA 037]
MNTSDTAAEPNLVERLQANAMDSLVHGVEHHIHGSREYDHKYVVLHVFHAVELFLKARLAKHDESLVYKKNGNTIGADYTIDLLIREAHIDLSKYVEDRDPNKHPGEKQLGGNLKKLKEARHNIEHKEIGNSQDDMKIILGEAFNFLDSFVKAELGLNLKNELDKLDSIRNDEFSDIGADLDEDEIESTYRTLSMSYLFYHRHMMERGIINYKFQDYDLFVCEECEEEAVAFPDPTLDLSEIRNYKLAHCFNCWSMHSISICARCESLSASLDCSWKERPLEAYTVSRVNPTLNENEGDEYSEDIEDENFDGFCDNCQDLINEQ